MARKNIYGTDKRKISSVKSINKDTIEIILKNANVYHPYSGMKLMMKNAFKKWLNKPENRKKINYTYISRWRFTDFEKVKKQKEKDDLGNPLSTFKGTIKINTY